MPLMTATGKADQSEGNRGQRDFQIEQGAVRQRDQGGDQRIDDQRDPDARQDRPAQNQEQPKSGRALAHDHAKRPRRVTHALSGLKYNCMEEG